MLQRSWKKGMLNISQGRQRSDGFRENSAMQRHYVHSFLQDRYSERSTLKLLAFYSNLDYETPGGLTLGQYRDDPSSARKATAIFPGAVEQCAGIRNKTLFGGLSNETRFNERWRYVTSVFGSATDFENPFITNYETRDERTVGLRTYLNWPSTSDKKIAFDLQLGVEGAFTQSDISNYGNNYGLRDSLQSADAVDAFQRFAFTQATLNVAKRLTMEAALSTNLFTYRYTSKTANAEFTTKAFTPQLMPRLALSYKLTQSLAWRTSASRGYSPPTVAEIRPSDNVVYTNLQPENGWNYETGLRGHSADGRWQADAVVFYFHLTQAIVRRLSESEAEYFVNAGGTQQFGFESDASVWVMLPRTQGTLRSIRLSNALTAYQFTFSNYKDNDKDYSGNTLTGVPKLTAVASLAATFTGGVSLFIQHNHTGRVPLNDANTAYAGAYDVVQMKVTYEVNLVPKISLRVQVGVDNLLDATYSLGNDLNAAGFRYYNPAPPRNYYGGVAVAF
jgi:iron complex outermembrane receptor protein